MATFEERMRLMDIRAELTARHVRKTNRIFDMWPKADTYEEWKEVAAEIWETISFLGKKEQYFPNYDKHIEQWAILHSVAIERMKMARRPEHRMYVMSTP